MIETWKTKLNMGHKVGVIYMDLFKAFDSLNHELLIAKLKRYVLDEHAVEFFRSYLSNRKSVWYIYKKFQIISTIYMLFEYIFLWNCVEFSHKMALTIQTRLFNNVKYRQAIFLKSGDKFFTSLTMSGLEAKISVCSTIKENLILYCRKFSVFAVAFNNKVCLSKKKKRRL